MIKQRLTNPVVLWVVVPAAALLALSVWYTFRLARQNDGVRAVIASAHAGLAVSSPRAVVAVHQPDSETASELNREREKLRTVEARAQELAASLQITPTEELKSLGRIEELARDCVQFLNALQDRPKDSQKAQSEGRNPGANPVMADLVGSTMKLEAIGRMESEPEDVAQLHAQALKEMLGLDQTTHNRVRDRIAAEFAALREQGLDRSKRPIDAQEEWYARRDEAIRSAAGRIELLIPPSLRKPEIVAQVLSLGSGIRARVVDEPNAREKGIEMYYELPGLPRLRL